MTSLSFSSSDSIARRNSTDQKRKKRKAKKKALQAQNALIDLQEQQQLIDLQSKNDLRGQQQLIDPRGQNKNAVNNEENKNAVNNEGNKNAVNNAENKNAVDNQEILKLIIQISIIMIALGVSIRYYYVLRIKDEKDDEEELNNIKDSTEIHKNVMSTFFYFCIIIFLSLFMIYVSIQVTIAADSLKGLDNNVYDIKNDPMDLISKIKFEELLKNSFGIDMGDPNKYLIDKFGIDMRKPNRYIRRKLGIDIKDPNKYIKSKFGIDMNNPNKYLIDKFGIDIKDPNKYISKRFGTFSIRNVFNGHLFIKNVVVKRIGEQHIRVQAGNEIEKIYKNAIESMNNKEESTIKKKSLVSSNFTDLLKYLNSPINYEKMLESQQNPLFNSIVPIKRGLGLGFAVIFVFYCVDPFNIEDLEQIVEKIGERGRNQLEPDLFTLHVNDLSNRYEQYKQKQRQSIQEQRIKQKQKNMQQPGRRQQQAGRQQQQQNSSASSTNNKNERNQVFFIKGRDFTSLNKKK
jgi:hypothetical protein